MAALSRRSLARYAAERLTRGQAPAKLAKELVVALVTSRRQNEVELLLGDIAYELENRGLLASATVTSATALNPSLRRQLVSQIKKLAHVKDVALHSQIDKKVIGGVRIDTAKHSWDKTILRKLTDIKGDI